MEVLEGQVSAFELVGDVKREVVTKEKKMIIKKKATEDLTEVKNIEGQASIFDLVQDPEEEIKIDFTKEQLETTEKLKKEKEWIEYSLYGSGKVLLITIESKVYKVNDRNRTYFINTNGEIDVIGIGITRWDNPVKTIVNGGNNE